MREPLSANGTEKQTDWNAVNWRKANRTVRNLRQRIFRATQEGNLKKVRSLQKLLLKSHSNRLVSVRRVTQISTGRKTPGIDKLVIKTPAARGTMVDHLAHYALWKAKPVRRVYIAKANGKLRPLGIPAIVDRCLQAMVKNALEPVWEAKFEGSSYGFRPGRSCHDAIAKIYGLARPNTRKKWVVDADIQGAFDNICHDHLLKTIGPVPGKELIKQWRKRRIGRTRGLSRHRTWDSAGWSRVAVIGEHRITRDGGGHWGHVRLPRPPHWKTSYSEICR